MQPTTCPPIYLPDELLWHFQNNTITNIYNICIFQVESFIRMRYDFAFTVKYAPGRQRYDRFIIPHRITNTSPAGGEVLPSPIQKEFFSIDFAKI